MAMPHCDTRIAIPKTGGLIVVRDVKTFKRPYTAPSFHVTDSNAVKAKLEAELTSKDQHARQMLAAIAKQLQERNRPTPRSLNLVP
jgi:hypothetical protein